MAVVLSGIQPSGSLHIGHLVGAIENYIALQNENKVFYMIADWHALTSKYAEVEIIQPSINELVATFLAVGLDPQKSTIFLQSAIKEHAELQLLLGMITPLSWLERVPTYKEKQLNAQADLSSYGFLGYPLLQAADILIYNADKVPVGEDQLFHLELTREIGRRFNHIYQTSFFKEPQAVLTQVPKVLGLDGKKMSKTYKNCIYLSDSDAVVVQKCTKEMASDPARVKRTDPGNPEVCPVFSYHKFFSSAVKQAEIETSCRSASIGCFDCKKMVSESILVKTTPIREKVHDVLQKPLIIKEVLREGTLKARSEASQNMATIRDLMKLSPTE